MGVKCFSLFTTKDTWSLALCSPVQIHNRELFGGIHQQSLFPPVFCPLHDLGLPIQAYTICFPSVNQFNIISEYKRKKKAHISLIAFSKWRLSIYLNKSPCTKRQFLKQFILAQERVRFFLLTSTSLQKPWCETSEVLLLYSTGKVTLYDRSRNKLKIKYCNFRTFPSCLIFSFSIDTRVI